MSTIVPSTRTPTRREVLAATLAAGVLGGDAAAQDSGSGESTPTAGSGEWPTFQDGPRNVGYAASAPGPVADGAVAWSRPVGKAGLSSPAVVGASVYVGTVEGTVVALSTADGTERWEFRTDDQVVSSPAVDGRRLFVGSDDGRVYALHTANGADLWSFETGGPVRSSPAVAAVDEDARTDSSGSTTGSSTSASPSGDRTGAKSVFVGSDDGVLYALGADGGSVRWTYDVGGRVGSPAMRVPSDAGRPDAVPQVFVGDSEGGVFALSAVDGSEQWTASLDGAVTAPTVAGDLVYVGDGAGGLYALSAVDGTERWRFDTDGPVASPAVAGDVIYLPVSDDGLYALSATDGSRLWHETMNGELGPPAAAGIGPGDSSAGPAETVFVAQGQGDVIVRALSAGDGGQRWAAEINGAMGSAPAVVGETLYVNAGEVAAIDERGRTPTPTGTPWDARTVLESWAPTVGAWLGAYAGVPAVLGGLVYALGRLRGGDRGDQFGDGGREAAPDEPADGAGGSGPDDDAGSDGA